MKTVYAHLVMIATEPKKQGEEPSSRIHCGYTSQSKVLDFMERLDAHYAAEPKNASRLEVWEWKNKHPGEYSLAHTKREDWWFVTVPLC